MANPFDSQKYSEYYQQLQDMLLSAYVDVYCLKAIGTLAKDIAAESNFVFQHIAELAKRDLCLSLNKLLFDENRDCLSIAKLHRILSNSPAKTTELGDEPPQFKKLSVAVKMFRDKAIAHNDKKRDLPSISIADMEDALDEARRRLNLCCCPEMAPGIQQTTDAMLMKFQLASQLGIGKMIVVTDSDDYKEGDENAK